MSTAAETAARMLDSLPAPAQEKVLEQLRALVAEAADEARWEEQHMRKRDALRAAARAAGEAVARGEATPMDYDAL